MRTSPSLFTLFVSALFCLCSLTIPGGAQGSPGGIGTGRTLEREVPPPAGGNILVLIADDFGVDSLGVYAEGNDLPPTPHLDALAADGVLFRNAWSQPTCSPTRACLQTGLQGFRNGIGTVIPFGPPGVDLDLEHTSLPEMLDIGTGGLYAHAAIGKWHLANQSTGDSAPNQAGYAHFSGTLGGQVGSYFGFNKTVNGTTTPVDGYVTSVVVDDTLDWIQKQSDQPWFCYVAFQAPHTPFHAPPAELITQELPNGEPRQSCADPTGLDPRPFFKAMVEAMDTEIGRLLAGLPIDVREKTTVIFIGDNGTDFCLGVPPFDGPAKSTLGEGGINVPLIVSGAAVTGRGECRGLVQTSDLFATVAELAGVRLEETLPNQSFDSVSMVPYFRLPERASIRDIVMAEIFNPNGTNDFSIPACPQSSCQTDLGMGTLGGPKLTSCGSPLYGTYTSHFVPLRVTNAPPNTQGTLRIGSFNPAFDPNLGSEVVSRFPETMLSFVSDSSGNVNLNLFTGGLSAQPYYQMVFSDPNGPNGFGVSNALQLSFLDTRSFAVRNERLKLIHYSPCRRELYDLENDPFEEVDLFPLLFPNASQVRTPELFERLFGELSPASQAQPVELQIPR